MAVAFVLISSSTPHSAPELNLRLGIDEQCLDLIIEIDPARAGPPAIGPIAPERRRVRTASSAAPVVHHCCPGQAALPARARSSVCMISFDGRAAGGEPRPRRSRCRSVAATLAQAEPADDRGQQHPWPTSVARITEVTRRTKSRWGNGSRPPLIERKASAAASERSRAHR